MSIRDYQEDPSITGHWKPQIVSVGVPTSMAGVAIKSDILLVLVVSFLCVDCEM